MKKVNVVRLWAWVSIVALPLWFGSCKKGSDDAVTPSKSAVEGNWKISGYKVDPGIDYTGTGQKTNDLLMILKQVPNGADAVECLTTTIITFNSNGKITGKPGTKCSTANSDVNPVDDNSNWKLDGNKLTITSGTEVTTYDAAVSGSTLKMSTQEVDDLDGDGKKETYTYTLELTKV
ncbi:lipocalin family protein [Spirosoma sp. BT702]|uniref:Lipocalin family protein n=1 Tax=Spirosoma profusum TaxID=2771354 RepID=A0A926XV75_9BACT|nr:lipocalin family protein [Spirosoma profusum]MBD2700824.1 lipocalin family protein [Spirosoma profusum]